MQKLYGLTCKNSGCSRSIVLPLPIRRETPPNLLLWPMDGKPRNFLCWKCNHAFGYTLQDVHSEMRDIPNVPLAPMDIWRIEAQCDEKNCLAPVYILASVPAGAQAMIPLNVLGVVSCSAGHPTHKIRRDSIGVRRDSSLWA